MPLISSKTNRLVTSLDLEGGGADFKHHSQEVVIRALVSQSVQPHTLGQFFSEVAVEEEVQKERHAVAYESNIGGHHAIDDVSGTVVEGPFARSESLKNSHVGEGLWDSTEEI